MLRLAIAGSLALLTACTSEVEGAGGGGAGTSAPERCCPPRGDLGVVGLATDEEAECPADGLACPWNYLDTGAVGGGVVTCEEGAWRSDDCPAFGPFDADACPAEGTDLGPCESAWEDAWCLCICPPTEGSATCNGSATCADGRWIVGVHVDDAAACTPDDPDAGCDDPVTETDADGSCRAERTCGDVDQSIDCVAGEDGSFSCSCFRDAASTTCVGDMAPDLACVFSRSCCDDFFAD